MAGLRLKKLVIERFRNVRPGTTLNFSDGMNVLLGKNGTGKSTLLDLVAVVASGNAFLYRGEPIEFEATYSFDSEAIVLRFKQEVEQGTDQAEARYRISALDGLDSAATQSGELTFVERNIVTSVADGTVHVVEAGKSLGSRALAGGAKGLFSLALLISVTRQVTALTHPSRIFFLSVASLATNLTRHDEMLGTYTRFLSASASISPHSAPFLHTLPTEFGDLLAKQVAGGIEPPRFVEVDQTQVPFLSSTVKQFGFATARVVVRLLQTDSQYSLYGEPRLFFTASDGTGFTESGLSFGQKRLFSFLYYAACNPDIVVADELVNGLHYEWAKLCLDTISDRQAFLSSQDPLLFDYLTFESVEQVEQSLILCSLDKSEDGKGQFVWKNVPREEAEAFFRSYENGLQHVSEILRAKGLW